MIAPEIPEPVRAPETPDPVRAPEISDPFRALIAPWREQPGDLRSQIRAEIEEIRDFLARVLDRGAWQEPLPPHHGLHPKSWAARTRGIFAEPLSPGGRAELERLRAELAELDAEVARAPESELWRLARWLWHLTRSLATDVLRRCEAPQREDGARWVKEDLARERNARAGGEERRRGGRREEIERRAREILQQNQGAPRRWVCQQVARKLGCTSGWVEKLLPASRWSALRPAAREAEHERGAARPTEGGPKSPGPLG